MTPQRREPPISEIRDLIDLASVLVSSVPASAAAKVHLLRESSRAALHPADDPAIMVRDQLAASLAHCWEAGWLPLDIIHIVDHASAPGTGRWATAAILAQVETLHLSFAPQQWLDQLAALRTHDDPVGSPTPVSAADWAAALTMLHVLRTMPRAALLLPPPSRWSASDHTPPGSGRLGPHATTSRSSDARMLTRIRALLAKAESTEFPAEADACTAKAQDLMTRHAIDEALLRSGSGESVVVTGLRVHIDSPYASAKAALLSQVAGANRTSAVWHGTMSFVTLLGVPTDVAQVEMLFTSLLVQATRAMTAAGSGPAVDRSRSFRRTFLVAYAARIGQRLAEASEEAVTRQDFEQDTERGTSWGSDLVVVLAEQEKAVDDETRRLFPRLRTDSRSRTLDHRGWMAGTSAANDAVLPAGEVGPVRRARS